MLDSINTLLVAVDLQADNKAFLQKTFRFVSFLKCSVILISVKEELPQYSYFSDSEKVSDEELQKRLNRLSSKFKENGIEVVDSLLEKGRPHRVIADKADSLSVSAILLSAGANFEEKRLIGNTADKIIRMANQHIILINQLKESQSNKVVCAFDFSKTSENTLELSKKFADLSQRSLSVMHVINKVYFSSSIGGANARLDHFSKIEKIEASAANRLKEAADSVLDGSGNTEFIIQQGIPAVQICSTVKKQNADWLFIGASGHNMFVKMFMGSTVEEVYRTAFTNIFIYKNNES